jgi:RNA polymerase sigma-70 factor (ECF subfamily)
LNPAGFAQRFAQAFADPFAPTLSKRASPRRMNMDQPPRPPDPAPIAQASAAPAPLVALWREHRARLRAFVARRVRDADAVDDIVQDIYVKAHTGMHALRSPERIAPWLYRIAANAIADHYRALRPTEELPEDLPAPEQERDFTAELARCVAPFLAGLPETYRAALELAEIDGLPQREVAERLGLSLSGAKSRVQRGRKLLRERFLECCDIEATAGGLDYAPRPRSCGCG